MAGFNIQIEGIDQLRARFSTDASGNLRQRAAFIISDAAQRMALEAKKLAPGNTGFLQNLISAVKIDELNYEVISGADYSAFVEFGTRDKAVVPPELEEFAAQFKGTGESSSLSPKEAIFEWCRAKGIEEELWWSIYISIMVHGVAPQPFFFPAADAVEPVLNSDMQKLLETL